MKKVIIISYFFPPANFAGSQRAEAWAKHLSKSGIYPIIITRNWNKNQNSITEEVTNNQYSVETTEEFEVRRLPYKRTLRDKCAKYSFLRPIQKALTVWELVMSNYFIKSLPYSNFYQEAHSLLSSDNQIIGIIGSGRPFQTFFIGFQLKNKFPQLKWIPDYRDEWNTHPRNEFNSFLNKIIQKLELKSELKWTKNADYFIAVSEEMTKSLSNHIDKKGVVILNGYKEILQRLPKEYNPLLIRIGYTGTIYSDQNFIPLIKSCLEIQNVLEIKIEIYFVGTSSSQFLLDQINSIDGANEMCFVKGRLNPEELIKFNNSLDFLFLTSYSKTPNSYPVKLFEYYASGIPLILFYSDRSDLMTKFVVKSNSGVIVKNDNSAKQKLISLFSQHKNGEPFHVVRNESYSHYFSREHQTTLLGELLVSDFNSELP